MPNYTECQITTLSREMAKIHKKIFGKGPGAVNVAFRPSLVIIKAEGVLTELEKNLLETQNGNKTVAEIRAVLIEKFKPEIIKDISKALAVDFSDIMAELFVSSDELIVVLNFGSLD